MYSQDSGQDAEGTESVQSREEKKARKKSKRRSKIFKFPALKKSPKSESDGAEVSHLELKLTTSGMPSGNVHSDTDGEVFVRRSRLMSDPTPCQWSSCRTGESCDEAYCNEIMNMSVPSAAPVAAGCKRHSGCHRHRGCGCRIPSLTDGSSQGEEHHTSGSYCRRHRRPQSLKLQLSSDSGNNTCKVDGYTSVLSDSELQENNSAVSCHCPACCSCHGNVFGTGCSHHQKVCSHNSDGTDSSQPLEADWNLGSPTSIDSWGHFSKNCRNHYKYRRSDYSSDSEEDLPLKKIVKSVSESNTIVAQKSHLPMVTLTRQNSTSSSKSDDTKKIPELCDFPPVKEGVKPIEFKGRLTTMRKWFTDFNDEQKNIVLKELLAGCDLPQLHLLSVKMEANLHHGCPPNCQDILTWLPTNQSARIMSYLDPVSLCRAAQVCKVWHQLTEEPSLWRRFCCQPKWRLSKPAEHKQVISHMSPQGRIQWQKVFAERFRLRNNWLRGRCTVRTFEGHSQGISCVQFDDTRIVSGSSDKSIKVWNIRTNAQWSVQTLVGHSGTVRCLHLEGNRLVSGSTDCMIKVWDLSTQESWSSIACKVSMTGHSDTVRCLQVDDEKVISGSYDKTLKVWDIHTGQCRMTLRGHQAAVLCVHFSDTKVVSGSCDKTIKVWNYEGVCMRTLNGHQDAVTCLQFDSTRIVSGSLDCNLKFWDIRSGECINTIDWKAAEGHTGVVRCLQADSWRLVSAADDKTIKVWNLETGKRLVTLRNHTDGVTCLQFNDFIIVSGSYDKTVKLWDFSSC